MKEFKMTIFIGSTMMTHQCDSMYGIISGLLDMANKVPVYGAYLTREVIDEFIEDLVALKHGEKGLQIKQSTPFIRIECVEPYCPPTLPDCTTEKEGVHG